MPKKITQQELARRHEVSQAFVSQSILGKKHSKKARNIRRDYGRALLTIAKELTEPANGRLAA
ncbi:hypothetical protein JW777_00795 [bacterium]|nr:hypothetical protein [bacterium]